MEKKKKSTCGCFSFLRRKQSNKKNKDFSASLKAESVSLVHGEADSGPNRSISLIQPRLSRIVQPSSQASFFPAVETGCVFNNTVDTALSRPNTLKTLPISHAGVQGVRLEGNGNEDCGREEIKDKGPFFVPLNGPSPDWLAGASKFASPSLGSIDLSPVKIDGGIEESLNVSFLVRNARKCNVPDIFIRSSARPSLMPVLKPVTPCLFTKRRQFAVPRIGDERVVN